MQITKRSDNKPYLQISIKTRKHNICSKYLKTLVFQIFYLIFELSSYDNRNKMIKNSNVRCIEFEWNFNSKILKDKQNGCGYESRHNIVLGSLVCFSNIKNGLKYPFEDKEKESDDDNSHVFQMNDDHDLSADSKMIHFFHAMVFWIKHTASHNQNNPIKRL